MANKRKPKKRKPTKKRKIVRYTSPRDIPFSKYRIEWVDCVSDSGWADEREFHKMKLARPVNEGWLFSKDRHAVKVFASYDREEDGTFTFGDRTMIPWAWIKKMTKLQ